MTASDGAGSAGGLIVAGVDGSEASLEALRWAARQAELTGASLEVVMSWEVPTMAYGGPVVIPYDTDLAAEARRALDNAVAEALGDKPAVKVSPIVVEGRPAQELVRAAKGAQLLVVGSRGHGAFAGMVLGSVSEYCAAHAPCPVVIVRRHGHEGATS
jgi:nucleotide-binding universal stress UspA family protein